MGSGSCRLGPAAARFSDARLCARESRADFGTDPRRRPDRKSACPSRGRAYVRDAPRTRVAMKKYQKSNANNRRPGPTVGGRAQRWVPGPHRRARPMRKETMSGIWRSPVLKPKTATQSPQKITTSTPNIISDRCRRRERNSRDLMVRRWKCQASIRLRKHR